MYLKNTCALFWNSLLCARKIPRRSPTWCQTASHWSSPQPDTMDNPFMVMCDLDTHFDSDDDTGPDSSVAQLECPVCLDDVQDPVQFPCGAAVCATCSTAHFQQMLTISPVATLNAWPFECPACCASMKQTDLRRCVSKKVFSRALRCGSSGVMLAACYVVGRSR